MSSYVPLWCKSNFSFLEGASHPDELIEEAHRLGLPALAITDRDGVYGIVRAHVKARELGLRLIVGSQVTAEDESTIILLAQDRSGYANLCRLLTAGRLCSEKGESSVTWDEIYQCAAGLIALWGGEEEGLLGSKAYVQEHFADRNSMNLKPEYSKLDAYFNDDSGTGRFRGISVGGNDMVKPLFEAWLAPFHDLGATAVVGTIAPPTRQPGGTDHTSFTWIGLPGFISCSSGNRV